MKKTLIEELIEKKLLTREQLTEAKERQLGAKTPLQEVIMEMGFVPEAEVLKVASELFHLPVVDLDKEAIDIAWIKKIPYELAKKHGVFPIREQYQALLLAMSDPYDVLAEDALGAKSGLPIQPVLCPKTKIVEFTERFYNSHETLYDLLKNIIDATKVDFVKDSEAPAGRIQIAQDADIPVVKLVNLMFSDAVKSRASDIHIEPQDDHFRIRYRVDGDLRDIMKLPPSLQPSLINRLKVLTDLDLAEKRKSQDGRMRIKIESREINIRISVIPTYHGEKVVMRLLSAEEALVKLEKLGLDSQESHLVRDAISASQGIVLVTGPTGSGKTTTLYSVLDVIKNEKNNIITVEDPVEYLTEGISQVQVNPAKDVTFASGLRSILRQDPNVILVGEIRDKETADMAFRASLTGHLIFSTLHTNNAIASITRLVDIGLEPYLIGSSLKLIVSQRLVKVICDQCREEYTPAQELRDKFAFYIDKFKIEKYHHGKGCKKCNFTGYFGRQAIFEILKIDEEISALISSNAGESAIAQAAQKKGMKILAESGMRRLAEHTTTLEEVARVADVSQKEISLPENAAPEAPKSLASEAIPEKKNEKILIVDDEDDIAKVLRMRLRTAGFEVVRAVDGEEGVEFAIKEKPDLILMDVMMPRLDGYQATRQIRSRLETAQIPIIMLTAKSDIESELKGIDSGADDYIAKPFDAARLLARIKMLLSRKERLIRGEK